MKNNGISVNEGGHPFRQHPLFAPVNLACQAFHPTQQTGLGDPDALRVARSRPHGWLRLVRLLGPGRHAHCFAGLMCPVEGQATAKGFE